MGDKTQLERIIELEEEVRALRVLIMALQRWATVEPLPDPRRRGNPNWVKRGSE